jgi:hypothetical protein
MPPLERDALKTFLHEVSAIGTIVLILTIATFALSGNPDAYGEAIEAKAAHLAYATTSPKIIFVGGSGLAFGIDSEKIKEATMREPVNLGLYAGVGIDPLLSMVEKTAKQRDVVVLIPEYQMLQDDPYGSGFILLEMTQAYPGFASHLHREGLQRAVLASPNWLKTRIISIAGRTVFSMWRDMEATLYRRVYRAENFNAYGDMIGHLGEDHRLTSPEAEESASEFIRNSMNPETRERLVQFISRMNGKGVGVYFSWQALPETISSHNLPSQTLLAKEIEQVFGAGSIIGTQEDFVFPDEMFFDTVNHLSGPAREARTSALIQLLPPVILAK